MTHDFSTLNQSELDALYWLHAAGGSVLVTAIPDKNHRDFLGSFTPGMTTFRRLAKKGFVFQTEEEPINVANEGEEPVWFTFTESIEFEDGVRNAYKEWLKP